MAERTHDKEEISRLIRWLTSLRPRCRHALLPKYGDIHPTALAKHGYEKARRIGMVAMVGGKDKEKIRDRTPEAFRDVLISIAMSAALSAPSTDAKVR